MKQNQQQQAQRLFFQSDFSKTEIADTLGISRSTLDLWIAENHWDILKQCSSAMPSQLADNCYRIMAQLTEHILSPEREGQPVTSREVNSLHKLSMTISKLKTKATISESMEMFAGFTEYVSTLLPELATSLEPLIEAYLVSRTSAGSQSLTSASAAECPSAPPLSAPALTLSPAPSESVGVRQAPPAKEKFDIRKALRGTATKGPGKAWREKQAQLKAQTAA